MKDLITQPLNFLLERLAIVTYHLTEIHSQLEFSRSQLLRKQRDMWESTRDLPTSTREKEVKYGSVDEQIAVYQDEAELAKLTEEKFFLIRLIECRRDNS